MDNVTNNYGIWCGVDFAAGLAADEVKKLVRAFEASFQGISRIITLRQNEKHFRGRVRHLMRYARKYRTRKKNENRILRYKGTKIKEVINVDHK